MGLRPSDNQLLDHATISVGGGGVVNRLATSEITDHECSGVGPQVPLMVHFRVHCIPP